MKKFEYVLSDEVNVFFLDKLIRDLRIASQIIGNNEISDELEDDANDLDNILCFLRSRKECPKCGSALYLDNDNRLTCFDHEDIRIDEFIDNSESDPVVITMNKYMPTKCKCGKEISEHHGDGYYSVDYKKQTRFCSDCGIERIFKHGNN